MFVLLDLYYNFLVTIANAGYTLLQSALLVIGLNCTEFLLKEGTKVGRNESSAMMYVCIENIIVTTSNTSTQRVNDGPLLKD